MKEADQLLREWIFCSSWDEQSDIQDKTRVYLGKVKALTKLEDEHRKWLADEGEKYAKRIRELSND